MLVTRPYIPLLGRDCSARPALFHLDSSPLQLTPRTGFALPHLLDLQQKDSLLLRQVEGYQQQVSLPVVLVAVEFAGLNPHDRTGTYNTTFIAGEHLALAGKDVEEVSVGVAVGGEAAPGCDPGQDGSGRPGEKDFTRDAMGDFGANGLPGQRVVFNELSQCVLLKKWIAVGDESASVLFPT